MLLEIWFNNYVDCSVCKKFEVNGKAECSIGTMSFLLFILLIAVLLVLRPTVFFLVESCVYHKEERFKRF